VSTNNTYTTQPQIRAAFWSLMFDEGKPRRFYGKTQNELPTDIRVAFVDFVDSLARDGTISEALAHRVTL
jgi:hypothetical protein